MATINRFENIPPLRTHFYINYVRFCNICGKRFTAIRKGIHRCDDCIKKLRGK